MAKAYASGFKVPARKPERTVVSEKAVDAFVDQESAGVVRVARKVGSKKRRAELGVRLNIILPPATAKRLRKAAVNEERSLSDAITEAVETWLRERS